MTVEQVVGYSLIEDSIFDFSLGVLYLQVYSAVGRTGQSVPHQNLGGDEKLSHDRLPEETRGHRGDGLEVYVKIVLSSLVLGGSLDVLPSLR